MNAAQNIYMCTRIPFFTPFVLFPRIHTLFLHVPEFEALQENFCKSNLLLYNRLVYCSDVVLSVRALLFVLEKWLGTIFVWTANDRG